MSREILEGYTETHHIIPKSLGGSNERSNLVVLTAREHFICHLLLPKMLTGKEKRNMSFALWGLCNQWSNSTHSRHKVNSKTYQYAKIQFSKAMSELHTGKIVSDETKAKQSAARIGYKCSDEERKKMTEYRTGRSCHNDESKKKISEFHKGHKYNVGRKHSNETKIKMSISQTGLKKPPHTEESKMKISKAGKGRKQSKDHVEKRFESRKENGYYKDRESTTAKFREIAKNREKIICEHCSFLCDGANFSRWHGDNCRKK